jgi:hypothetical protein
MDDADIKVLEPTGLNVAYETKLFFEKFRKF